MHKDGSIVERNGKRFMDVVKILPKALPSEKSILWRDWGNGLIEISSDKNSSRGGTPRPIIIKRIIEVDEESAQLFGLWFGDGIRIQWGSRNVFGFSNIEIALHKTFLKLSNDYLSVNSNEFHCSLSLPIFLQNSAQKLENKISKELDIPIENFWKSRINPTRNSLGIDVKINSRLLGFVMHLVLDEFKRTAVKDDNLAIGMLKGIIASEANVHVRREGRLGEISIGAEEENERYFIRQLLLKLKIQPNKDKTIEHQGCVLIHGLSNFKA